MSKTKLDYFLGKMSSSDLKRFEAQLSQSSLKKDQALGKLLNLLKKKKKDPEYLYAQLYPGKAFSRKQIGNLKSELFGRLTDFLAIELFESSPEKSLFVAAAMNRMGATRHFPAILEKYIQQEKERAVSLEQMALNNRLENETLIYQLSKEGRRELPMESLITNIEETFVAQTLYLAIAHSEAQGLWNEEKAKPPIALWEPVIKKLERGEWAESRIIQIYYGLYKLATHPEDPAHYKAVKSLLTDYGDQFDREEAQRMYTPVQNYCIRTLNQGNSAFLAEFLDVFQEMRDRGLLLVDGGIDGWLYKTIVSVGARTGRFEWTHGFIEEYKEHLIDDSRDQLILYCQGVLAFFTRNFELAESKMYKVLEDFSDPFFGLDARSYLLRIYYESGNFTSMDALLNSFRLLLKRYKQLSPPRLNNYKEFIRFFRRLVRMDPNKGHLGAKLRRDILESPYNASRDWLLEKVEEMYPQLK